MDGDYGLFRSARGVGSAMYFTLGIPGLCVTAAVFGYLEPMNSWRWGLVPMLGQALCIFSSQGLGNLWPLGVIAFGIFSIPLLIAARIGAGWSKRTR